jgi:hypothetical protein
MKRTFFFFVSRGFEWMRKEKEKVKKASGKVDNLRGKNIFESFFFLLSLKYLRTEKFRRSVCEFSLIQTL